MKKVVLKNGKKMLSWIMLVFFVNVFAVSAISLADLEEGDRTELNGEWPENSRTLALSSITIYQYSQYLTIQDSNPVNTITVRITHNDSGATVFENVYPKGQTSLIVIPMNGWSGVSYTIELFGRENNGYLWGTFQVLP